MPEQLRTPTESQPTAYPFTSIIVLKNSGSKQAGEATKRIRRLEELFPGHVDAISTDADLAVTRRTILDTLTKHFTDGETPVLAIAGGDGTVNIVLQTLVSASAPDFVREIPIVPLGTGNANDLAFMLYDNPADIEHILYEGRAIDIRPLECLVAPPAAEGSARADKHLAERRIAGNYISFGATAHGAHELNKPSVRAYARSPKWYHRWFPDFFALRAALQAPSFYIEHNGERKLVREAIVGNGDRAAKLGRMPSRLTHPEMYTSIVRDRGMGRLELIAGAIKIIFGRLPGKIIENGSFSFVARDGVPVQYDGEAAHLLPGSEVTISHADLTFRALTTKL